MKFILLSVLVFSSCAILKPLDPVEVAEKERKLRSYITGTDFRPAPVDEMEEILSRKASLSGGEYLIRVTAITEAFVDGIVVDQIKTRGLVESDSLELKNHLSEKYTDGKTCFKLSYVVTKFDQAKDLKDWLITVEDSDKVKHNLIWENEDLEKPIVRSSIRRQMTDDPQWIGSGVACSRPKINLSEGFKTYVKSSYVAWPFDQTVSLAWKFDYFREENGEKVLHKKVIETQPYRDW